MEVYNSDEYITSQTVAGVNLRYIHQTSLIHKKCNMYFLKDFDYDGLPAKLYRLDNPNYTLKEITAKETFHGVGVSKNLPEINIYRTKFYSIAALCIVTQEANSTKQT